MSEEFRALVEITFNILYLVVVWGLVYAMWRKRPLLDLANRRAADITLAAFALLAFGDSGHVGFRILGYLQGDMARTFPLLGMQVGPVGAGTLMTSITVTFFYVLMLALWQARFNQRYGWFEYVLLFMAGARFVIMLLPANQWNSVVPPQPISAIRNLPLSVLGLGVAFLMLRDGTHKKDSTFQWIGGMILFSYACYLPVIFFVQQAPLVGMLMIPKTLAYLAIGFIAYSDLYRTPRTGIIPAAGNTP